MKCARVQANLSLYLYGELDFVQEEEAEEHLAACPVCQAALSREKTWHSNVNAERMDVPLDLLSECRRNLTASSADRLYPSGQVRAPLFQRLAEALGLTRSAWPLRLAVASLLVSFGFLGGRFVDSHGLPGGVQSAITSQMDVLGPFTSHVRDIQQNGNNEVRILIEQVREQQVMGKLEDAGVKELLLQAAKDSTDAGIRVNSVEMLQAETGDDVRDALLASVRRDPNAAVRLKALEGLRRFAGEPQVREVLKTVLLHDDNPAMRSEAIEALAPAGGRLNYNPDLARVLQQAIGSASDDDYVRSRCMEILNAMQPATSPDVY